MARIGMFMNLRENDPEVPFRKVAFLEGFGPTPVTFDYRYGGGEFGKYDARATELIDLKPDLLFATCGPSFWAFQTQTATIPIVYAGIIDPTQTGRGPGSNSTGYASYSIDNSGEWLNYLKDLVPGIKQVVVVADLDPIRPAGGLQVGQIRAAAAKDGITVTTIDLNWPPDKIAAALRDFATKYPGTGGLIMPPGTLAAARRDLVIGPAMKSKLPSMFGNRLFLNSGGICAYGATTLALYKLAGDYAKQIVVDKKKPADLPRQINNSFELVIHTKAAKAAGISVPPVLLKKANHLIE